MQVLEQSILFDGQLVLGDEVDYISLPQNDKIITSLFQRNGAENNGKHLATYKNRRFFSSIYAMRLLM